MEVQPSGTQKMEVRSFHLLHQNMLYLSPEIQKSAVVWTYPQCFFKGGML
jgi:hypothetical protein